MNSDSSREFLFPTTLFELLGASRMRSPSGVCGRLTPHGFSRGEFVHVCSISLSGLLCHLFFVLLESRLAPLRAVCANRAARALGYYVLCVCAAYSPKTTRGRFSPCATRHAVFAAFLTRERARTTHSHSAPRHPSANI